MYPSHDPVDSDLRRELAADSAQDERDALTEPLEMEIEELKKEVARLDVALTSAIEEIDLLNDENDQLQFDDERRCLQSFGIGFAVGWMFATVITITYFTHFHGKL